MQYVTLLILISIQSMDRKRFQQYPVFRYKFSVLFKAPLGIRLSIVIKRLVINSHIS